MNRNSLLRKAFAECLILFFVFNSYSSENSAAQTTGGTDSKKFLIERNSLQKNTFFSLAYDPLDIALYPCVIPSTVQNKRIWFITEYENEVWITGDSLTIAKSNNFKDWEAMNNGLQPEGINCLEFVNQDTIFAGGMEGSIYRTTDGGNNWMTVYKNVSLTNYINKITFFDPLNGIALGDQSPNSSTMAVLNTTDGGTTWNNYNTYISGSADYHAVEFEAPSYLYLRGQYMDDDTTYQGVWVSPNRGTSWDFKIVGQTIVDATTSVVCIMFQDSLKGYAAKADSTLWMTVDGALSWTSIYKASSDIIAIIHTRNPNIIFCIGSKGLIAKISLEPNVSIQERPGIHDEFFNVGYFADENRGYLIDYHSSLDRFYTTFETTTGIHEKDPSGLSFALSQNFPNPFNPVTTIDYSVQKECLVKIDVYDVLGNHVTALVNEVKPQGSYQTVFDASGLSSGIYFYQIRAANLVETKKLILME